MEGKRKKSSSDRIVSVSALVVAAVSIGIAVWTGMITRQHNRLSVRPRLEIFFDLSKDSFGYIVVNNGLGPAVITQKKILVDGAAPKDEGTAGFGDFLSKLGLSEDRIVSIGTPNPGFTIRSGESENIILLKLLPKDNMQELLSGIFRRVSIEIVYQSMYGESFWCRISQEESTGGRKK